MDLLESRVALMLTGERDVVGRVSWKEEERISGALRPPLGWVIWLTVLKKVQEVA